MKLYGIAAKLARLLPDRGCYSTWARRISGKSPMRIDDFRAAVDALELSNDEAARFMRELAYRIKEAGSAVPSLAVGDRAPSA